MTADFWLLVVVLWIYFFLMVVEPDGPADTAEGTRLPHSFMFPPDVIRAAICASPLVLLHRGLPLDGNPLLTWIALTLLIEPLLVPSAAQPRPEHSASFVRFVGKWFFAEGDRIVKTAVLLVPMLLLSLLVPADKQLHWLDQHFSFVDRLPKSFDLSLGFYVAAFLILSLRFMLLLGIPKRGLLAATAGWVAGSSILIYFYNLTGQVHLSEHDWEYPAGGIAVSLAFRVVVAFLFARFDRRYEADA